MENNENNENNVQNQVKQKDNGGKAVLVILLIILLILTLAIGIGGGYLLSQNNKTQSNNASNSNNDNKNENKVVSVVEVENNSEMVKRQMTIEGKDKDNNTVWSYTTPKENIPEEIVNRGLKLIETRKGKVYLCDWGKLYILDEQTGKVLAKNTEHNMGAAKVYVFDENDNLYTISYLSSLDKFDTNANLVKSTGEAWDKGLAWPQKMTLNGNNLTIDYGDEGVITFNKDTFETVETKQDTSSNSNNSQSETAKYLGKWYDEDNSSELNVLSIANGYCSFSWSIYRLTGLENTVVSLKNNSGSFYFQGYDDKNFNSIQDDGEHYYRKATISLNNDSITIKVENVDYSNYDITQEKNFDGQVYLNDITYTYKIK